MNNRAIFCVGCFRTKGIGKIDCINLFSYSVVLKDFSFSFSIAMVSFRSDISFPLLESSSSRRAFFPFVVKGQLQRFYKLISNNRIWPSEHGLEVIFEKSLFVFEISAFKVRNKCGIHSRFHSFSENINRETFVCDVTSDQSSMISTERSDLRDCKASENCCV